MAMAQLTRLPFGLEGNKPAPTVHFAKRPLSVRDAMSLRAHHAIFGKSIYPNSLLLAYNDGETTAILVLQNRSTSYRYVFSNALSQYFAAMPTQIAYAHEIIVNELGRKPCAGGGMLSISDSGILASGKSGQYGQGPTEGAQAAFISLVSVVAEKAIAFAAEHGYEQIVGILSGINRTSGTNP